LHIHLDMTRVLLLEDSVDVLEVLQIELELMGYRVDAATEATAALASARSERPDVIVSDLGLPGMDGLEFIRLVRATPGLDSVPAIALTGAALARDVREALAVGFTAHMTKPIDARELHSRIAALTARPGGRKSG
jgi:CheY-like chemotaxis protein